MIRKIETSQSAKLPKNPLLIDLSDLPPQLLAVLKREAKEQNRRLEEFLADIVIAATDKRLCGNSDLPGFSV